MRFSCPNAIALSTSNVRSRTSAHVSASASCGRSPAYAGELGYVSLLISEGLSVVEVARRAGHAAETCLRTYAHMFDESAPERRVDAETTIRAARDELVRSPFATGEGGA